MKTLTRSSAAPARWIALLSAAPLLLGSVAAPAPGEGAEGDPPDVAATSEVAPPAVEAADLMETALAESDSTTQVVYTGQGFDNGELGTEACGDGIDLGQGSWDDTWGDIHEVGYLKWVFNQAESDEGVVLAGPWGTVDMTIVNPNAAQKWTYHAVTPYYPVNELLDGVVHTNVGGGQLVVSNGCPGIPEEPEPVTITLAKEWFDEDGEPTDEPAVDWGIQMTVDDQVVASLPGEDNHATFHFIDVDGEWHPARYGVTEDPAPEGWEQVSCETVNTDTEPVNSGLGDYPYFAATESGIHLVCNQQLPEEPEPEPEPVTVDIGLMKVWLGPTGEVLPAYPAVTFEVTLSVDGELIATLDGTSPEAGVSTELVIDTPYEVAEATLPPGWEQVACPADVLPDGTIADGGGSFVAEASGIHIICNQAAVEVAPIVIVEPEPEPEPAPVADVTPVAEEEELPPTGTTLHTLALLAGAMLLAGTATLLLPRRTRGPDH